MNSNTTSNMLPTILLCECCLSKQIAFYLSVLPPLSFFFWKVCMHIYTNTWAEYLLLLFLLWYATTLNTMNAASTWTSVVKHFWTQLWAWTCREGVVSFLRTLGDVSPPRSPVAIARINMGSVKPLSLLWFPAGSAQWVAACSKLLPSTKQQFATSWWSRKQ